jgi:hypothetical protein
LLATNQLFAVAFPKKFNFWTNTDMAEWGPAARSQSPPTAHDADGGHGFAPQAPTNQLEDFYQEIASTFEYL